MSALGQALIAELDAETLDQLAVLLAPRLAAHLSTASHRESAMWLNARQAAAHLACSRDRLYDLVQLGKLEPRRDGRRLLFRRDDLDSYLEASA
jgi:excisionase family DNA binding protein